MSLQSRFGKVLHVSTRENLLAQGAGAGEVPTSANGSRSQKSIRTVSKCSQVYSLGKEVMPSTHSYMKVVFAKRLKDGQESVIKIRYKPTCFRSREDERSWRRNTEFLLNMPEYSGVARVYEVLEDDEAFYVVMEKVAGNDLFETLESEGRIQMALTKNLMRQMLSALSHLHLHNAIHKDLKLENVMVDLSSLNVPKQPGAVKIIDFDTLEEWTPNSPKAKDVVGTDQYIAQEAYAGSYSPLSDMFSVGVIAFRVVCGKFPYLDEMFDDEAGENWVGSPKMSLIRRRLKAHKLDFSQSIWQQEPQAKDLIQRMLAYNELQRPSAAAALEHPWLSDDAASRKPGGNFPAGPQKDAGAATRTVNEDLIDDGIIIADDS